MPPDHIPITTRVDYDGRRYRIDGHRADAGLADVLKWRFNGKRARWPRRLDNNQHPPPPERVGGADLRATWIGHATVLLQTAGLNILTDPFLSDRASPLSFIGPRRVRPPALTAAQLPPIDIVLLSHNHYDHMDLPTLRDIARNHAPRVVTPRGNAAWIGRASRSLPVDELAWGESVARLGVRIHLTPALHWSKRQLFGANTALWGAFAVETPGGTIYFAGDTGFGTGATFSELRRLLGPPRLSLLPIGAYEPRWLMRAHHMNPDDAVAAHRLLESRTSLAIHHATIQLTDEAIDAPAAALRQSLARFSIDHRRFLVPDIGETLAID